LELSKSTRGEELAPFCHGPMDAAWVLWFCDQADVGDVGK
jgi:hypothetical protein